MKKANDHVVHLMVNDHRYRNSKYLGTSKRVAGLSLVNLEGLRIKVMK